jgi:hypothetical protein
MQLDDILLLSGLEELLHQLARHLQAHTRAHRSSSQVEWVN